MEAPTRYDDDEIRDQIDAIPVTGDGQFDVDSLFTLVENIFKQTAPIVDTFLPVRYTTSISDLFTYEICLIYLHPSLISVLVVHILFFESFSI